MDELFEAYLAVYEENELEKRAKKNKEALDTGFMKLSDEERKKESKRLDDSAKRESSRMKEEYNNLVLDYLITERYVNDHDSAARILEAMSDEWLENVLMERRRVEKGTPRKTRNLAFEIVAKKMGSGRVGVQPRGVKKVPGQKPPKAGEYGSERYSPEQIIAGRRARKAEAERLMHSRFD
jgi:hypothetical protein